jgi:arylsulfatase A-like enzyme
MNRRDLLTSTAKAALVPAILEAAGLPEPKSVNGTEQIPMQGASMVYSFDAPQAPDRHLTQHFEIVGNRAIYHDGWLAGTIHKAPWELQPRTSLADDRWELYDTRADFSLAAANPTN